MLRVQAINEAYEFYDNKKIDINILRINEEKINNLKQFSGISRLFENFIWL